MGYRKPTRHGRARDARLHLRAAGRRERVPLIRLTLCARNGGCEIERGWSGSSVALAFYSGESIDQTRDSENEEPRPGPVDFSDSPLGMV